MVDGEARERSPVLQGSEAAAQSTDHDRGDGEGGGEGGGGEGGGGEGGGGKGGGDGWSNGCTVLGVHASTGSAAAHSPWCRGPPESQGAIDQRSATVVSQDVPSQWNPSQWSVLSQWDPQKYAQYSPAIE